MEEHHSKYAGFWRRFAASAIDGIIIGLGLVIVGYLLVIFTPLTFLDWTREISDTLLMLISLFYFPLFESSTKMATPGKEFMKIKVTNLEGNRISREQAFGRYLGHIISFLTLGIGYLMMLWTKRHQTLHDKMAGTLVVKV